MENVTEPKATVWRRPLRGWRWLAAWAVLIVGLASVIWTALGLATEWVHRAPLVEPVLLSTLIALSAAVLLGILARGLSSWRNFKRLVLTVTCLAGLTAFFYIEENVRGRLAWGRFRAQWEATGEKLDFAGLVPPRIPDQQNFAMTPLVASSYSEYLDREGHKLSPPDTNVVNRLQMPLEVGSGGPTDAIGNWQKAIASNMEPWQRYYRQLSLTTNLFPAASQVQAPASDVLLALSKYDSTIEELRQAATLPACRFPLDYDNEETYAILLPHLAPAKGCAVMLRLRSLAALESGQSEKALADISLALRLIEKYRSDPFLISHLVRIAMVQITTQAIWEGMARHCWTDAQLVDLEQQLAALDFVRDYQMAMRTENACQVTSTEFIRKHRDRLSECGYFDFGEGQSIQLPKPVVHLAPSGWFYQNELNGSRFFLEKLVPIGDVSRQTISPALSKQANEALLEMRPGPYTVLCRMFLPGVQNSSRKFAFAQAAVNLARTAAALERHRLAHGIYPETLAGLAPRWVATVPADPIGGQPLCYRLRADGLFVLYSLGWNDKDDDGTVSLTQNGAVDPDNGDWVWRYPDSAEILSLGKHHSYRRSTVL